MVLRASGRYKDYGRWFWDIVADTGTLESGTEI